MQVAVLGGTGLIGWHTVRALREAGHGVRVLARRPPVPSLGLDELPFHSVDLLAASDAELAEALRGCTAVVQAAGADPRVIPRGSARDYFFAVNVDANVRLLRVAKEVGVEVVVLLTSYFHTLRPEMVAHPYVASRLASEDAVLALDDQRFRVVVLQPPYVFGTVPGRRSLGDDFVLATWVPLPLPSGGTNAMSVTALAQSILGAVERDVRGRFLVGDENLSWSELFRRFGGRALPLPTGLLRAVMWLARGALRLGRREFGLDLVPLVDVLTSEMFYDPTEVAEQLGYVRGGLDQAIVELKR